MVEKTFEGKVEYDNAECIGYMAWVTVGDLTLLDMLQKMTYEDQYGEHARVKITIEIVDPGKPLEFNKDYVEGRLKL